MGGFLGGVPEKDKSVSPCFLWGACLASNKEPDRYERPALTIELQAPPQAVAFATATVPPPLTMWLAIRQCRARNCSRATGLAGRVDRAPRVAMSRWAMIVMLSH